MACKIPKIVISIASMYRGEVNITNIAYFTANWSSCDSMAYVYK